MNDVSLSQLRRGRRPQSWGQWWALVCCLALLLALLPASAAAAANTPPLPTPTTTVTYCNGEQMDIYEPADAAATKPAPAVMWVHGGGLVRGNRQGGAFFPELVPKLTAQGFVVTSIDYRLGPQNKWPDQIEDTTCAVRFLRANAATYHIDPSRIGAWGGSAGGLLVNLLGTIDPSSGFDNGAYANQSSRVQAVVDLFGPAGVQETNPNPAEEQKHQASIASLLPAGITPNSPAAQQMQLNARPVHWISKDDPPFLILQGDQDTTVDPIQSQEFARQLQAAGVNTQLVIVKGGRHGLQQPNEQPSPAQIVTLIVNFFVTQLQP